MIRGYGLDRNGDRSRVIGTADLVPGTALVLGWEFEDGQPVPQFQDETVLDWDRQEHRLATDLEHGGELLVVLESGDVVPLGIVKWVDEPD